MEFQFALCNNAFSHPVQYRKDFGTTPICAFMTSNIVKLVLLIVGLSTGLCAGSIDWPAFRGPNTSGSVDVGNYPTKFSPATALWKVQLPGKGTSTPIVHKNQIIVTSPSAEGQDAVIAFDLNGKELWQTKLGQLSKPKHATLGSSANASPATDGDGIFVYFRSGNFAALELDGKVRWQTNLVEKFGAERHNWDTGTSPVLTHKLVVMTRLHTGESWIAGFDKKTGELKWRELRDSFKGLPKQNEDGYSPPLLLDNAGTKALMVLGADHLTAHNAENGKLLWTVGNFNPEGGTDRQSISSPVISGNIAVVSLGRDDRNQPRMHGIKLGGSGDMTATHRLWKREDTGVFVPSLAEYKGRVYLLRNKGEIVCLDPATGKSFWTSTLPQHRSAYYASPVIANGILYAAREDGMVFAGRIGAEGFELLGENPMGERIVASPTPAGDRLFIRGDNHLFCFGENQTL